MPMVVPPSIGLHVGFSWGGTDRRRSRQAVASRLLGLHARPMVRVLVQVATQASHWRGMHDRPTLAPALVAQRLLGLLARQLARVLVQVATQASCWMTMPGRPTLAPALVAPRLLGLLAPPMVIVFRQVAKQASH